jgi:hypothetical protein
MKRRSLLKLFGVGAATAAVPTAVISAVKKVEPKTQPELDQFFYETPVISDKESKKTRERLEREFYSETLGVPHGMKYGQGRIVLKTVMFRDSKDNSVTFYVGEGSLTYTELPVYVYTLDRGALDTVHMGDEHPLEVSLDIYYDFVESAREDWLNILRETPVNELDMVVLCEDGKELQFPGFNYNTIDYDLHHGALSISGRCSKVQRCW